MTSTKTPLKYTLEYADYFKEYISIFEDEFTYQLEELDTSVANHLIQLDKELDEDENCSSFLSEEEKYLLNFVLSADGELSSEKAVEMFYLLGKYNSEIYTISPKKAIGLLYIAKD